MKKLIILLSMLVAYSIAGTMTDSRDGKTYRTVKIGKQTWMAENLNYKTSDSYCYNNNEGMCKKYGRLYKWNAAKSACPSGWHLPSNDEWNTLWTAVGGTGTAGTKLKSKSGWYNNGNGTDYNGNGTDSFGFAVLPAGFRNDNGYYLEGKSADFWSSSEYGWGFYNYGDDVSRDDITKNGGFSVRCLQDSNEEREASLARPSEAGATTEQNQGRIKDPRDGKTYRTVKIGKQTWMAENLNYKTSDSYCYNYNEGMCKKYGRLYKWNAAKSACPSGWHLPSNDEWNTLWTAVGGIGTAGTKLKSKSGWNSNGNGSDSFGFAVLPAGYRDYDGDFFEGSNAYFWSSTELNSNRAYTWNFNYSTDYAYEGNGNKNLGFSVRCLRNSNEEREASLARPSEAGATTEQNQGRIKDPRDGKTYKTVKIGNQTWMAENLNYKTNDSYCYNNDEDMCKKYGRLYTWHTAKSACPSGWHLPNDSEWNTLWTAVGGTSTAGTKLKSKNGWYINGNGSDSFGFAVLPAGYRRNYNGYFSNEGEYANFWSSSEYADFWSSSEYGSFDAYGWYFYYSNGDVDSYNYDKNYGFSVRCLQDSNEEREASLARPSEAGATTEQNQGRIKDPRDGKTYKTVKIGNQVWMAENLNYKTSGSMCYDNKNANCQKYGRLYSWKDAQNACPTGWHLPSREEFETLVEFVGNGRDYEQEQFVNKYLEEKGLPAKSKYWKGAGLVLKSRSEWIEDGYGRDEYGFGALPAGYYNSYGGDFDYVGSNAYFWSSTEYSSNRAYLQGLYYGDESADVSLNLKGVGNSVRCIKD